MIHTRSAPRRLATWTVAVVLLASGAMKLISLAQHSNDAFAMLVGLTGLPRPLLVGAVSATELALSVGLVLRRWTARASIAAFLFVLVMTLMSLMLGDGYTSCGCFGRTIKMNWQAQVLLNAFLLALTSSLAWPHLDARDGGTSAPVTAK